MRPASQQAADYIRRSLGRTRKCTLAVLDIGSPTLSRQSLPTWSSDDQRCGADPCSNRTRANQCQAHGVPWMSKVPGGSSMPRSSNRSVNFGRTPVAIGTPWNRPELSTPAA